MVQMIYETSSGHVLREKRVEKNADNKSLPHTVQGMKIFKICHVVKGETTNYAKSCFTRELSSHSDLHKRGLASSNKYE